MHDMAYHQQVTTDNYKMKEVVQYTPSKMYWRSPSDLSICYRESVSYIYIVYHI